MANDQLRAKLNSTHKGVNIAHLWHVKAEVWLIIILKAQAELVNSFNLHDFLVSFCLNCNVTKQSQNQKPKIQREMMFYIGIQHAQSCF